MGDETAAKEPVDELSLPMSETDFDITSASSLAVALRMARRRPRASA